jgi:transposase
LEGLLPPDHLARFIWQVLASLDFGELEGRYRSNDGRPGRSPYHPRLVTALWIYGMTQGMETAAAIAQACHVRDDFRWLAGGLCPSDQTLLNFLTGATDSLGTIWRQVLLAMHDAGHVDLSALVEDGTKLRANASPRSFHTAPEIDLIVADLERDLAAKLQAAKEPAPPRAHRLHVRGLTARLERAKQAATELRLRRAQGASAEQPGSGGEQNAESPGAESAPRRYPALPKFGRTVFQHEAARDVLICPAGKPLHFLGIYREPPRTEYRLYRTRTADCRGCALKVQCTDGERRSVKIPIGRATASPSPSDSNVAEHAVSTSATQPDATTTSARPMGPRASITEPEAVMMLATSEKRWEPSYNADLTVTRHGIIVSQFLTKNPTDYPHFRRALPAVLTTLGRPDAWIGDGHYATQENVLLAHRADVVLYAPLPGTDHVDATAPSTEAPDAVASDRATADDGASARKFCSLDFRPHPERNVLVCPAGEELRLIGTYSDAGRAAYRVYGRSGCGSCSMKPQCTEGHGRRVKLRVTTAASSEPPEQQHDTASNEPPPSPTRTGEVTQLLQALDARMREIGNRIRTFRSTTIEPVNAQLKQHGIGRFHVHGLARCANVLTLACVAHNLMKWRAREAARALRTSA